MIGAMIGLRADVRTALKIIKRYTQVARVTYFLKAQDKIVFFDIRVVGFRGGKQALRINNFQVRL